MYRRPFHLIKSIKEGNGKARGTCYKLYRYVCSEHARRWNDQKGRYDYSYKFLSGRLNILQEKTGLSKVGVMSAKSKLMDMKLLRVEDGQLQAVHDVDFSTLAGIDGAAAENIESAGLLSNSYFSVPKVSMVENIFCEKWSGTTALVYDSLCEEVNRRGTSIVRFDKVHFLPQFSRNTLKTALKTLDMDAATGGQETGTGFIQVRNDDATAKSIRGITIEMLDPGTSQPIDPAALSVTH
jgi:hypothetical protein